MKLEVKGHSGCQIDVVREDDGLYLYKSTHDQGYLDRLQQQGYKQQNAGKVEMQHIRVPKILDIQRDADSVTLKMEYVYSKNFIGYFEYAGFEQISFFIQALRLYLAYEIQHSPLQIVGAEVLKQKFADVCDKIQHNSMLQNDLEVLELLKQASCRFDAVVDMQIPVGLCHGDLTFSNILFNGNNYYLIDFLDSFVESPLLDIVKIRQDSSFLWSQLMYSGQYDEIRLKIVANKIDEEIVRFARQYDWFRYYPIFQLMNFLRVLQYAHEERVVNYLKQIINQLLHEF